MKKIFVFSLLAAVGCHLFALAADKPALRTDKPAAVAIMRISPSKGDVQRIEKNRKREGLRSAEEVQVHVIKIYAEMPTPGGQACVLYIGDEKIPDYGGFDEGIFFKTYDAKQLQSWQGKPVRFRYKKEMIDLKVTVPAKPDKTPTKLPTLDEALKGENSR